MQKKKKKNLKTFKANPNASVRDLTTYSKIQQ